MQEMKRALIITAALATGILIGGFGNEYDWFYRVVDLACFGGVK